MLLSGALGADRPGHVHGSLFSARTQLCLFAAALSHGVPSKGSSLFMGPSEIGQLSLWLEEHLGRNLHPVYEFSWRH